MTGKNYFQDKGAGRGPKVLVARGGGRWVGKKMGRRRNKKDCENEKKKGESNWPKKK